MIPAGLYIWSGPMLVLLPAVGAWHNTDHARDAVWMGIALPS